MQESGLAVFERYVITYSISTLFLALNVGSQWKVCFICVLLTILHLQVEE